MGKLMLSIGVVFLLVAAPFPETQGLECYSCYDISFLSQLQLNLLPPPYNPLKHVGWKAHKSCANGNGIRADLKETCIEGVTNDAGKNASVVCSEMRLFFNMSGVELPELPPGTIPDIVTFIARGCLYVDPDVEDPSEKDLECKERDFANFTTMVLGPLKDLIDDPFLNKTTSKPLQKISTNFEVCTCNNDLCAYDECQVENPPESCTSSENPGGSSTVTTECTGNNCGAAESINSAKMSVLAVMFGVFFVTLY